MKKVVKQKAVYLKEYVSVIGKPKVLFIWIPKNAGTSLYESLNKSINMKMFLSVNEIKKKFTHKGAVTFGHINLLELIIENIINQSFYENSLTFCICRNPYDRFVSLFHYLKKQKRIPLDYKPIDLITEIHNGIPSIGLYNFKGISQCNRQVDWIEGVRVDKILRFENLNNDVFNLSNELGYNLDIPHVNQSIKRKTAYKELNSKTIDLIKEYYEEDFLRFKYSMKIEK